MEDVNRPRQILLFLYKLECGPQEINSRDYLLHFRQIGLNATKLEKLVQIHFYSDVFAAFAVVDAKAPTEIKCYVKVMQFKLLHRIKTGSFVLEDFCSKFLYYCDVKNNFVIFL